MLKKSLKTVTALLLLVLILVAGTIPAAIFWMPSDLMPVDNSKALALDNINYVDVHTGQVVRDQQLLIKNGLIEAILPAGAEAGEGYASLDGRGGYVSPGLFDMHVHVHDRKYLAMNLALGVTSVRCLRGLPMHLRWKRELAEQQWLGSNLYASSPVLDGEKYSHALQEVVTSPEVARRLVARYANQGYDMIKAYGYLDALVFDAIINEAAAQGIPVVKHGPDAVEGLSISANAGLQSLEHVEDIFQGPLNYSFDPDALSAWVEAFKTIDPVVTPTLATFNHLTRLSTDKQAFIETLPLQVLNPVWKLISREFTVKRWLAADRQQADWNIKEQAFLLAIVKELDRQGVTLLLGSDAGTMFMPAGISTHVEIELMQQAGLSAITVLQAGTVNAAMALGVGEQVGSIEPGKIADLLLVEGNPLEDLATLSRPLAVVKNGQWLGAAELASLRTSADHPANWYSSIGQLLEDLLLRALQRD